jgi:hypothetical protein
MIQLSYKERGDDCIVTTDYLKIGRLCGDGNFVTTRKIAIKDARLVLEQLIVARKQRVDRQYYIVVSEEGSIIAQGHTCCHDRRGGCSYLESCQVTAPDNVVLENTEQRNE